MRAADLSDMTLKTLFCLWPAAMGPFLARRMLCAGCPITPFHTVANACRDYGLDEAAFCDDLLRAIQSDGVASSTNR